MREFFSTVASYTVGERVLILIATRKIAVVVANKGLLLLQLVVLMVCLKRLCLGHSKLRIRHLGHCSSCLVVGHLA